MAKKSKKKSKPPETPLGRLKAQPLWFWGLTMIVAGVAANLSNGILITAQGLTGAAARGAKFGGGIASLFFVLSGVVLIVMHFARRA